MKIKGIKITKVNDSKPWRLNVAKSLFGKQIRKRFSTRSETEQAAEAYGLKLRQKDCTPLDPEIHQVAALFQDRLSAAQFMNALNEAVQLKGLSSFGFFSSESMPRCYRPEPEWRV